MFKNLYLVKSDCPKDKFDKLTTDKELNDLLYQNYLGAVGSILTVEDAWLDVNGDPDYRYVYMDNDILVFKDYLELVFSV